MGLQLPFLKEIIYVLSGILIHVLYFIHGEHHLYPLAPIKAYGCLILMITTYRVLFGDGLVMSSIFVGIQALLLHIFGLFLSIIVYRVFFHRLCGFPGPVAARISMGWLLWQNVKDGKAYLKLASLQEKYGKFVRIGPNKLVVFDASILHTIENPANGCTKSDWYDCGYPTTAINTWRDISLHDARRKVWANAFRPQSMAYFDTIINYYSEKFVRLIAKSEGSPMNLTHYFSLLAFDVIGEVGFSHTFGTLERGAGHKAEAVKAEAVVADFMKSFGAISSMPWLCRIMGEIPGLLAPWTAFLEWCHILIVERTKSEADHPDIVSALISHSREAGTLEQDSLLLRGDAQSLIIAGSDTVAVVLTYVFYNLCLEPEHQKRIKEELSFAPGRFDAKTLQKYTYLNAVIEEAMRLHSPGPMYPGERLTGPAGLTIDGVFIPPNVAILPARYMLGRMENNFEKADTFLPERWYPDSKLHHEKRAHLPFGEGRYGCIGRALGLMEIRCIIATLLNNYSVRFADEKKKHRVVEDMKDHVTAAAGRLDVVFDKHLND